MTQVERVAFIEAARPADGKSDDALTGDSALNFMIQQGGG